MWMWILKTERIELSKIPNRSSRIVCNSPRWNQIEQVGGAPGVGSVGIPVWKLYGKTAYRELKANFNSNVCLRTQEFHCKN